MNDIRDIGNATGGSYQQVTGLVPINIFRHQKSPGWMKADLRRRLEAGTSPAWLIGSSQGHA